MVMSLGPWASSTSLLPLPAVSVASCSPPHKRNREEEEEKKKICLMFKLLAEARDGKLKIMGRKEDCCGNSNHGFHDTGCLFLGQTCFLLNSK